jgi:hypothetical protein
VIPHSYTTTRGTIRRLVRFRPLSAREVGKSNAIGSAMAHPLTCLSTRTCRRTRLRRGPPLWVRLGDLSPSCRAPPTRVVEDHYGRQNGLNQGLKRPKTGVKTGNFEPLFRPRIEGFCRFPGLTPHLEFRGPENVAPGRFLVPVETDRKTPTGVGCRHGVSRLGTPRLREGVWPMTTRNPPFDCKVRRSHMRRFRPFDASRSTPITSRAVSTPGSASISKPGCPRAQPAIGFCTAPIGTLVQLRAALD